MLNRALLIFGATAVLAGGWYVWTHHKPIPEAVENSSLVFRLEAFAIGLDPAVIVDVGSRRIVDMIHAKLFSTGIDGVTKGELAENWRWTSPNVLEIKIRPKVTFSNGKVLTAKDVEFSICRLLQPTAAFSWLFSNVKNSPIPGKQEVSCDGITSSDDQTVLIEVTSDPERLMAALATTSGSIVPTGEKPGEFGVMPGAGPYTIERIEAGSQVVLKAREGGVKNAKAERVTFRFVADDGAAATLFKTGGLDAIEIGNPNLYGQLINSSGQLSSEGRLIGQDVQQVRVLIFNIKRIANALNITEDAAQLWKCASAIQIANQNWKAHFAPFAVPVISSYFPAPEGYSRPQVSSPDLRGRLQIITEADAYSDAIAGFVPQNLYGVEIEHVGLEKSVLISRLISKDFDIASVSLEAVMATPAYWRAFFTIGSPFTAFGTPIAEINDNDMDNKDLLVENARLIDEKGNWVILFSERRFFATRPNISGETFFQTGLVNYSGVGVTP